MPQPLDNSWTHFISQNPNAKLRLFCFHYSGGNANIFNTWAQFIPNEIELCAIQLPGRMDLMHLNPFQQFDEVIQPLCEQLLPYLRDKPFVFFGHSLGALLGYSLSHYLLENHHITPRGLMIAACASPSVRKSGEPIHLLPENAFIEKLSSYHSEDNSEVRQLFENREFMQLMLPILRADFALSATYKYVKKQPFDFPIFAYGGDKDPQVSPDEITAWHIETTNTFEYSMFDGDHFFTKKQQETFLKTLISHLQEGMVGLGLV
ncbi:MAG: thioesterase domain-containing protein [Gammaproteobacteria bacterium]|nr:thioesterase domain-containing protein [Gammaproteobacteria bacterium]